MNLQDLREAILADPEAARIAASYVEPKDPDYYAKDSAIARIMRARGWGVTSRAVPAADVKLLLIARLRWAGLGDPGANLRALCDDARLQLDLRSPTFAPLLEHARQYGVIDDDDIAAMHQLCTGESPVTPQAVSRALRGPWGDV